MADSSENESERARATSRAVEGRSPSARELALRSELLHVRHELRALLDELDAMQRVASAPRESAVVTSVLARTALLPVRRD